jgi:hypothetical protein
MSSRALDPRGWRRVVRMKNDNGPVCSWSAAVPQVRISESGNPAHRARSGEKTTAQSLVLQSNHRLVYHPPLCSTLSAFIRRPCAESHDPDRVRVSHGAAMIFGRHGCLLSLRSCHFIAGCAVSETRSKRGEIAPFLPKHDQEGEGSLTKGL